MMRFKVCERETKMVRNPSVDENGMRKGAWSEEEDNKLKAYILRFGHWNWRQLPKFAGLARCGKSCRLRWLNYLKPGLKKGSYSKEEEEMIIKLHKELGNKWSLIAAKLSGRTDNEIKNYWNAHSKKARKQEPTEKTNRLYQNIHVTDQKDQNSSLSLSKTSDQETESGTAIAAADASTQEISSLSYNFSTILDGAENSFSSDQESYPNFFESFWTEPFYYPTTLSDQIPSSSSLVLEDWFKENEIYSEQSFVKTFDNLSVETVFSNASSNLVSLSESCNNSMVTHSGEASADTFEGFPSEPFCLESSYHESIDKLPLMEEEFTFTSFLNYDFDPFDLF